MLCVAGCQLLVPSSLPGLKSYELVSMMREAERIKYWRKMVNHKHFEFLEWGIEFLELSKIILPGNYMIHRWHSFTH